MSMNFVANIKGADGLDGIGVPLQIGVTPATAPSPDFDELTETAVYFTNSRYSGWLNFPAQVSARMIFRLEVYKLTESGRVWQVYTEIGETGGARMFARYRVNASSEWSPWGEMSGGG